MKERTYYLWFFLLLTIRVVLAWAVPLTPDEAHHILLGLYPDYGYYDHPAMAGWLSMPWAFLGHHTVLFRLTPLLITTGVALSLYLLLRRYSAPKAALISLLYLISPQGFLHVLVTTDAPMVLWVFACALATYFAVRRGSIWGAAAAGLCFGAALISKYLALFTGLPVVAIFLWTVRPWRRLVGFLVVFALATVPVVAVQIMWNYNNCLTTFYFNFRRANEVAPQSLVSFATFIGQNIYLLSPWTVLIFLRRMGRRPAEGPVPVRLLALFFFLPMLAFGYLSLTRTIGLHWVLAYVPFFFLLLWRVPLEDLQRAWRVGVIFMAVHVVLIGAALRVPVEWYSKVGTYRFVVLAKYPQDICAKVKELSSGMDQPVLATQYYGQSATFDILCAQPFIVFDSFSSFGRLDDKRIDFRTLDGRDFLFFHPSRYHQRRWDLYFTDIEEIPFEWHETTMYFYRARGFQYERYRDIALQEVKEKFYSAPYQKAPQCYFYQMYFPEEL